MQMGKADKVRALALLEGGIKKKEVVLRVEFLVKTTRKLQQAAARKNPGEAPQRKRKPGLGRRKSCGAKECAALKKAIIANPKITCMQLKIRVLNTSGHLSRKTINTIIKEDLGRRIIVSAIKPFLTNSMRENCRLGWATGYRYWGKARWGHYLYADKVNF